jgi:hypothetical protein
MRRDATGCEDGTVKSSRRTREQWQPVLGDDIGPTRGAQARSAVGLFVLLVVLGVAAAGTLGLVALALLTLAGASIG